MFAANTLSYSAVLPLSYDLVKLKKQLWRHQNYVTEIRYMA